MKCSLVMKSIIFIVSKMDTYTYSISRVFDLYIYNNIFHFKRYDVIVIYFAYESFPIIVINHI